MKKKRELSLEDKKTWEKYIKYPKDIFDKERNNSSQKLEKNRYKFDLHGFTLEAANLKVKELINYCIENKYRQLLLITGKGIHSSNEPNTFVSKDLGKLKYSVPDFIYSNEDLNKLIISISEAEKKDGGTGALLIKLKNL